MSKTAARILLLLASAALLAACGIKGDLDRPPPLWGGTTDTAPAEAPAGDSDALDRPTEPSLEDEEDGPGYGVDVAD